MLFLTRSKTDRSYKGVSRQLDEGPETMAVYNYDYAERLTVALYKPAAHTFTLFLSRLPCPTSSCTSMQHHVPAQACSPPHHPISLNLPSILLPFSYALTYTSTWIVYTRVHCTVSTRLDSSRTS